MGRGEVRRKKERKKDKKTKSKKASQRERERQRERGALTRLDEAHCIRTRVALRGSSAQ